MNLRPTIARLYLFFRRHLEGRGLSRHRFLRNINFAIENFLKRQHEYVSVGSSKIYLDPSSGNSMFYGLGDDVPFEMKFVESILKEGDVFVDVGAHIGWFTVLAAKKVGSRGKVYSFEPDKRTRGFLMKNIAANDFKNVVVFAGAVAEKSGTRKFFLRDKTWVGNSFYDPMRSPDKFVLPHVKGDEVAGYAVPVEVETVSLDDYLGNKKVDVVKIDVEGAEQLVVKGMRKLLRQNNDIIVISEFSPALMAATDCSAKEFLKIFTDLGFSISEFDNYEKKLIPRTASELLVTYTINKANGTDLLFKKS